jgi:hypothetical protein
MLGRTLSPPLPPALTRRISALTQIPLLLSTMSGLWLTSNFARAQTASYTFESAAWALGNTAPFLNVAPDTASGLASFRASFTASPTSSAFAVGTFILNPAFTGKNLWQPGLPPGDVLSIALNQSIRSVHLDFEQFAPGHLDLTSAAGTISVFTDSQIGSLDFVGSTSFTSFTLAAFDPSNNRIPFGIDNLVLSVPEPRLAALAGLGAAAVLAHRARQHTRKSFDFSSVSTGKHQG